MTRYAQAERTALSDLFLTVGPDGPTLCEGWTARDLAAHLVLRERRMDAAPGIALPALRGYGEKVRKQLADQPYERLVAQVREAPWWSPVSNPLTDEVANTMEFFIHHEDVRRAQPGWQPRTLPTAMQSALWSRARGMAKLALRRFPASVLVRAPGFGEVAAGAGGEQVRLVGEPGELVLFLSGRQESARVQVEGSPTLAERLRGARLGM